MAKEVTLEAEGTVSIDAKIRCAYSFDQDKDYYQITLNEYYPGKKVFGKARSKVKHGIYSDKYAGFALEGVLVDARLKNLNPGVNVSTLESVAPDNHPANGTKETINGWTLGEFDRFKRRRYCRGLEHRIHILNFNFLTL